MDLSKLRGLMGERKTFLRRALPLAALFCATSAFAGDADINLPLLRDVSFCNHALGGYAILYFGLAVCVIGALFGLLQYKQTRALPVHRAMGDVSNIIWETCKTYLQQQGKFLAGLWLLIALCIIYYFWQLQGKPAADVVIILACSILGILERSNGDRVRDAGQRQSFHTAAAQRDRRHLSGGGIQCVQRRSIARKR